jgi:hypothetical protein
MDLAVAFHPVRVLTGSADEEGFLVVVNGGLAGVLVRLSAAVHEGDAVGRWFLEAAFGRCAGNAPTFASLECADRWFRERLSPAAQQTGTPRD